MVVILESPMLSIVVMQERTAASSRCTVQAPHSAMPQPYLVPVRPSTSRRYHSSGICGSPLKERSTPLTLRRIMLSSMSETMQLCHEQPGCAAQKPCYNRATFEKALRTCQMHTPAADRERRSLHKI